MRLLLLLVVAAVLATTAAAGRRRWKARKMRRPLQGCHRAEEGQGRRYVWTLSGLNDDDLQVTFMEGAYAPQNGTSVVKYPRDRGQKALGLFPAMVFYDFSDPEAPVSVIRQGRRGRGLCIVVDTPDVETYHDLISWLEANNGTNRNLPTETDAVSLVATRVEDDSQFSDVVRDICSKDQCGRPVLPTYFVTDPEAARPAGDSVDAPLEEEGADTAFVDDDDDDDDHDDDSDIAPTTSPVSTEAFQPTFMMVNTRVTVTGLPGRGEQRWERRQQRRQQRRQHPQDGRRTSGRGHHSPDVEGVSSYQRRRQDRRQERRQQRQETRRQSQDRVRD